MSAERWVEHHRLQGHHPYPAPTFENPQRWECKCDPDAVWTAVYRIHTREQIAQKYAHLSKRGIPKQAEQERKNAELASRPVNPTRLTLAPRYAKGSAVHERIELPRPPRRSPPCSEHFAGSGGIESVARSRWSQPAKFE